MQQRKQLLNRKGGKNALGRERTFYAVLAGASLLVSGLAVATTLLGPALAPSHFSNVTPAAEALTLSHVAQMQTSGVPGPAAMEAGRQTAPLAGNDTQVQSPPSSAEPDLAALAEAQQRQAEADKLAAARAEEAKRQADAAKAAEAQLAAKQTLAAKLTRLNQARTLQVARAARARTQALENAEAPTTTVVAASQVLAGAALDRAGVAPDTQSMPAIALASLEQSAMRSLARAAPEKPGAIVPRVPAVKPEPPQRAQRAAPEPAVQNPDEKPETPLLAYATPGNPEDEENGVFSGIGKLFGGGKAAPGRGIAVYDISAATVHMPDGSKLEAHSGIGQRMDNPKHAYVKNYGPTPPNVYKLRMRERLFHGVEAIRMLPYDREAMKGRDGMLTHTRLLRRSIGSHGCVAFKDYNKFLTAFKQGRVKTLIVVPSMDDLPRYMAMHERGYQA